MPARPTRLVIGLLMLSLGLAEARGDEPRRPPTAAIGGLHPVDKSARSGDPRPLGESSTTGGWWLGAAGLALALGGYAVMTLASKKRAGDSGTGSIRVVGRLNLSPRHAIHQVRVGDRVLLIGTGSQGPPALLGEMSLTPATDRNRGGGES